MQRLVNDTNVLVSSLIQRSFPFLIVSTVPDNKDINWCISDEVLAEYSEVLRRVKFSKYNGFGVNAEKLLIDIEVAAIKYNPEVKLYIIRDASDNKFLELDSTCQADFLITGNTKDFTMSSHGQTKIVTPKEYWEEHR